MKIIINATDVHSGGGKIMLDDLLTAALDLTDVQFHVFTDPRHDHSPYLAENIHYHETTKSKRLFVDGKITDLVDPDTIVLNIGDMPPFRRHACTVIQFLMNRYFINDYSMKGLPLLVRLRLTLQKWAFRIYLKNADQYFVQNMVMKDLLLKLDYPDEKVRVIPYKNIDISMIPGGQAESDSFLYVASDEPHKNHINLVKAWKLLGEEGIRPTLYLTIDKGTELYRYIETQVQEYGLDIRVKPALPREKLLAHYRKVKALIYPSFFECFGIPMIEALNFGLPVLAAELDYVRDHIEPAETFDPASPRSIARAVKRFLGAPDDRFEVLSAKEFIWELEKYA